MRRHLIFILLFSFIVSPLIAQKYLQVINDKGREKMRLQVGDPISVSTYGDPAMHTSTIMRIDYEQNYLNLENWIVPLDSIAAIRANNPRISKRLGTIAFATGLPALFTSVAAGLFYKPANTKEFVIATGGLTLSGLILKNIGRHNRVYTRKKGFQFRLLNLTIEPPAISTEKP